MAIRIKTINGLQYLYQYTSIREGKKVRQISRYLRKATEDDIRILGLIKEKRLKQQEFKKFYDQNLENMSKMSGIPIEDMQSGKLKANGRTLRSLVKMTGEGWNELTSPLSKDGRLNKSHARGTMNASMQYQLFRLKDNQTRTEVYKYIKLKKIKLATVVKVVVDDIIKSKKSFKCVDYLKVNPDYFIHKDLLIKYLDIKFLPDDYFKDYLLEKINKRIDQVERRGKYQST